MVVAVISVAVHRDDDNRALADMVAVAMADRQHDAAAQ